MQTAMYNSVVIPNNNAGNAQGCYYYAQSYDGSNAVHGSPMGQNQQPNGGGVDRSVCALFSFSLIFVFLILKNFDAKKRVMSSLTSSERYVKDLW